MTDAIERAARRARRPRFPPNLSGAGYRRLLLDHIDTLVNTDTERAETARWREAVSGAPADELQSQLSTS